MKLEFGPGVLWVDGVALGETASTTIEVPDLPVCEPEDVIVIEDILDADVIG